MKLYHGSKNKNLQILEPKRFSYRDKNEGPVVFATPYKQYAYCFLINQLGDWPQISRFNNDNWTVIFKGSLKEIQKIDNGGAIYEIDSTEFISNDKYPTGDAEWISKKSTTVQKIDEFDSAIEAMIKQNINLYFVDKDTARKIDISEDHGFSIIQKLKPFEKETYS